MLRRWYVRRFRPGPPERGYNGPFSARRARKEAAVWLEAGWSVTLLPSTPEVRAKVRDWENGVPYVSDIGRGT